MKKYFAIVLGLLAAFALGVLYNMTSIEFTRNASGSKNDSSFKEGFINSSGDNGSQLEANELALQSPLTADDVDGSSNKDIAKIEEFHWRNIEQSKTPWTQAQWDSLVEINKTAQEMSYPSFMVKVGYEFFYDVKRSEVREKSRNTELVAKMWNAGDVDSLRRYAMARLEKNTEDIAANIILYYLALAFDYDIENIIHQMNNILNILKKNDRSLSVVAPILINSIQTQSEELRLLPTTQWEKVRSRENLVPPLGEFPGEAFLLTLEQVGLFK